MKTINVIMTLALAAFALLMLNACSGTSNGSNAVTAAAYSCTLNAYGSYVDQNGNACSPTGAQTICPATGYYPLNGTNVACTPGQLVNTTGYNYGAPNGYPYGTNSSTQGCTTYYAEYGELYVPIYLNGQLVCANYADLISSVQSSNFYSSFQTSPYYQGGIQQYQLQYMYAYPPNLWQEGYSGGNCGIGAGISFSGLSISACFNDY